MCVVGGYMKKILRIIFGFVGFIYLVAAVFAIVCLIKKNDYGYPQFNNKTLIIIDEDNDYYKSGDLVIIEKPSNDDVKINDGVFFYDTEFKKNTLNVGTIIAKEKVNENETTFQVQGHKFSSEYLVGKIDGSMKYSTIGKILGTLTSKWGFFFIIIIPFFIMFMVEIIAIYSEIRYGNKKKI